MFPSYPPALLNAAVAAASPSTAAQPADPSSVTSIFSSTLSLPSSALSAAAANVAAAHRSYVSGDGVGAFLHAVIALHSPSLPQELREVAESLKRGGRERLVEQQLRLGGGEQAFIHLQAALRAQLNAALPFTSQAAYAEVDQLPHPSPAPSPPPAQPQLYPLHSGLVRHPALPGGTPLHPLSAPGPVPGLPPLLPSLLPFPPTFPSLSAVGERTAAGSPATSCKWCGRVWTLEGLTNPVSRTQRNKQLKAKRDHQPYCTHNPARKNNLDRRRSKKKLRAETKTSRRTPGGGAGGGAEAGSSGGGGGRVMTTTSAMTATGERGGGAGDVKLGEGEEEEGEGEDDDDGDEDERDGEEEEEEA